MFSKGNKDKKEDNSPIVDEITLDRRCNITYGRIVVDYRKHQEGETVQG